MSNWELDQSNTTTEGKQRNIDTSIDWITVQDASLLFSEAGLPRNKRTIRRYCERGDLKCRKTENALHSHKYFIVRESVETYIAQQKTLVDSWAGSVRAATWLINFKRGSKTRMKKCRFCAASCYTAGRTTQHSMMSSLRSVPVPKSSAQAFGR